MHLLSVFILVGLMFAYASIGGVVFHYIEIEHETEVKMAINKSLYDMIDTCVSYDDILALRNISFAMSSAGVFVKEDATTIYYSFWDYRTALLAAIEALTLVGNPAFSARTLGGRVFSVFYVLIGQFIFYVAYMLYGRLLFGILSRLWSYCRNSFCRTHLGTEKLMKYVVLAVIGVVFFLAIPAYIFSSIEQWNYGRAFYFVFGTLLSIGFYDIPTLNPNLGLDEETMQWYRLSYGFWLLFTYFWFGGILLAYFIFIINLMQTKTDNACDGIIDDIKHLHVHNRPQIPVPVAQNVYQLSGHVMQPSNSGAITNVAHP